MCTETRHSFSTRNLLFIIIVSNHHNLTFSQHISSTEIWSPDPWFARPVSYRCATAAFVFITLKYGGVAALGFDKPLELQWRVPEPMDFE